VDESVLNMSTINKLDSSDDPNGQNKSGHANGFSGEARTSFKYDGEAASESDPAQSDE